ncbi:Zn2Cys6 transcription factor [Aspergillus bombycis]|uniref:Zn2Cys6 transcription factor n=1 Tax=Aspergillus bombycis TaxID=109264 RepID=A0A1F7ZT86_9EURO|nr:Zn2Cys6 transcription factor [Aspergillus bombycis]OGM42670.1 Zn2Cys6 transcription factor [Aspergillus bombycis]
MEATSRQSPVEGETLNSTQLLITRDPRKPAANQTLHGRFAFPQAKQFITQCSENSTIVGLAREVQFLQGKLPRQLDSPAAMVNGRSSPELVQLRVSLPAKSICDRLLRTYTDNFEKIHRIIHVPSFRREYAKFWTEPDHEFYQSSSAFIPQLTAICTISLALDGQRTKVNDSALWEYLNGPAITLVQRWVQNLSRKGRTELAALQVETLLHLSRRLRLMPAEELWKATGALIRSAMVMGLHLNLAKCSGLSVFAAQVRRRLWITIVEMDLDASIASGMPVMTSPHDVGPPPANLDDADFDESTSELPPAKGPSGLTDSIYQVLLAKSLAERLRTMSVARTAREQTDLSELIKQGRAILEHLRQIPSPLKLGEGAMINDDPAILLNRVLLDIYTRRPLLCLYRPVVIGGAHGDPDFAEICRICLGSSLAILSYQDHFDPSVADLEVCNLGAYWDLFHTLCKHDILWDAISVCGYIRVSTQRHIIDPQQSGRTMQWSSMHSKASLTRIVEHTLDGLTTRIGEPGSNLKDVLLLAVVLQSVRARGSTQAQEERMSQGASKALSACRQHLLPAVAEDSLALNLTDFAQMLQTTQPMFTPDDISFSEDLRNTMSTPENVAIIGAGLSGLTLALALRRQSIPCTIYEARSAPLDIGGAIMLSPNALRILDILGVYQRIRPQGYEFDHLYFRSPDNELVDTYEFGHMKYGYHGLRIYRHVLIKELSEMVAQANIPVHYNRKFLRVISETCSDVTWQFDDETTATATCLVGADGIHSRVRRYLYPDLEPRFTNAIGVTAAVPTSQLEVPGGYEMPVTIMNSKHGAFVIAPQLHDGSEVLIGRQKRAPELGREGWDRLLNDKQWCIDFLREGASDYPDIVQRAVSQISPSKINLWPFYVVPKLDRWRSHLCRVSILGDAAHAIPPSAGQGINQAFEDVYTFSLVFARKSRGISLEQALRLWQQGRQARVDKVLELNAQIDKRRMPKQEGNDGSDMHDAFDLEWLYRPDFDAMVDECEKIHEGPSSNVIHP